MAEKSLYKTVSALARCVIAAICSAGLAGCIMMKMSAPTEHAPEASARIGRYEVRNISIENAGLSLKPPATNFMDIDVEAIRSACNDTSDGGTNSIPVSIKVRRLSRSDMGFFTGTWTVLGACTLGVLPLYDPTTFRYEILITDGRTSEAIGIATTGFSRWNCFSLLPIPWLVKTASSDYYWMGGVGKTEKKGKEVHHWVAALGEYEAQVIKDSIVKCLSSDEVQHRPERLIKEKKEAERREELRKERARLQAESQAKKEAERRLAEEEAEKKRIARGVVVSDFFGISFRKDVTKEMQDLGVFSEDIGIPGTLRYFLGREGASFRRELSGSHTFDGFRVCSVLTDGETNGVVCLIAEEKELAVGRDAMVNRAQRHIDRISKALNYKESPSHTGTATEHNWTWVFKEKTGQAYSVQLSAKVRGENNAYWAFSLTISEDEWCDWVFERNGKRQRPAGKEPSISTGTGWFVNSNVFVTCEHVIHDAKEITFYDLNRVERKAKVLAASEEHDLAILLADDYVASETLPIKARLERMATHVFTIGYPFSDLLGSNQKYTDGVISASAGLAEDKTCYQISVPIQPGNSGGALINDAGEVVGVTSSVLNALATAKLKGAIPQNVNYAVKARYVVELLEDNGISYRTAGSGKANVEKVGKATILLKVEK